MLDLAIQHKDAFFRQIANTVLNERYRYYHTNGWCNYRPEIKESSWDTLQCVSLDAHGNVIGFLEANIDRSTHSVDGFAILAFTERSMTFARDLYEFLHRLFEQMNLRKMFWLATVGNPANRMYERLIRKYGGRIVGIAREETVLWDGTYADLVYYELMREDYLKAKGRTHAA